MHAKKSTVNPPLVLGRGHARGMMAIGRAKNTKAALKRLGQYLGQERAPLITVFILTAVGAGLTLLGPYLIGKSIDNYILPRDYQGLLRISIIMIGVYFLTALGSWIQIRLMTAVSQRTVWTMRNDLFAKLQLLPLQFFDSKIQGELMSRVTNDIDNISTTLNQSVTQLLSSLLTVCGALIIMLSLNVWLTFLGLLSIPLVIIVSSILTKKTRANFLEQQKRLGQLNGYIEEAISGQKVIKIFCREEKAAQEFNDMNIKLKDTGIKAQTLSGIIPPVMMVINNFGYALIAALGGWMATKNIISIGTIVSFINYIRQFTRPVNELANQFNMIQSAIAGAERVFEIMDEEPELNNANTKLCTVKGEVVFKNVYFSYDGIVPVLKNVNFTANPGETIALVGPTGAGKTTIVNLLTRFYDIDTGSITIDRQNIENIDKNNLRQQLGIVLQDAYLFADTIRENIRYGRLEATDAEVETAAQLANADSFIKRLPHGYETILTDTGGNLSQGQRQLITIARAILADPAILILDEATSSVDTRTEMNIQEAMKSLMQGRTSFVIAHRLSTIREADIILVINGGEIIERGQHEELLKAKGFYYSLYTSQLKKTG